VPAGHTEYDLRATSKRRSRCGRQHAVQACRTPLPPLHPAGIDQLAGDFRLTLDQQIGRAPSRRSAVTGNVNPEASTLIPTMATITCGWPRVTPMWTDVPTATCARRSTSTTGRSSTASPSLYTAPAMGTSTMVAVAYFTGQGPWHRRHPRHHEGLLVRSRRRIPSPLWPWSSLMWRETFNTRITVSQRPPLASSANRNQFFRSLHHLWPASETAEEISE
jgi:hypothetical protein